MDWYALAKLATGQNFDDEDDDPVARADAAVHWVPLFSFYGRHDGYHGRGHDDEPAMEPEVQWTPTFPGLPGATLDSIFKDMRVHSRAEWSLYFHSQSVTGIVLVGVPHAKLETVGNALPEWEHDPYEHAPQRGHGILSADFTYTTISDVIRRAAEAAQVNLPGQGAVSRDRDKPDRRPMMTLPPRAHEGPEDYYKRLIEYELARKARDKKILDDYYAAQRAKATPKDSPRRDPKVWGD